VRNFKLNVCVRKIEFNLEHVVTDLRNQMSLLVIHVRIRNGKHGIILQVEVVNHFQIPINYIQYQIIEIIYQGASLKHFTDILLREVCLLCQNYEILNRLVSEIRSLMVAQPLQ
jgi:hypothetical protein